MEASLITHFDKISTQKRVTVIIPTTREFISGYVEDVGAVEAAWMVASSVHPILQVVLPDPRWEPGHLAVAHHAGAVH